MSAKNNLSFSVQKKKTPFQRHKELEDEKKRRADEEAAKLYEEFVESFAAPETGGGGGGAGGGDAGGHKAFVRGGTVMPGTSASDASNNSARGKAGTKYVPSFMPPPSGVELPPKPKAFDDSLEESVFQAPSSKKADKDKPRNIDKMLETLKREQEAREEIARAKREGRAPIGDLPLGMMMDDDRAGSFLDSSGDPNTTNLYVGNLAPDVDEKILEREFGRFGPIASVKIMWPRDDEQRAKKRNCGFVAFMKREDAQASMDRLNGIILHDYEMKIGWSKAVALPAVALYPGTAGAIAAAAAAGLAVPGGAAAALRDAGHVPWASLATVASSTTMAVPAGSGVHQWSTGEKQKGVQGVGPDIEVQFPEDNRLRFIIDSLALYVLRDGCAFEQLVMEAEQRNPEYAFLFDLDAPEHIYYRWRLCSLAEGDTLRSWRIEPFQMVAGGQRWLPPSMTAAEAAVRNAAAKASEVAASGGGGRMDRQLSDLEHEKFGTMLRSLTVERADIGSAMVFALDNADAAGDVVEVLAQSLTLPETPVPTKVARLFLTSDILHNSTAPVRNASRYRSRLEAVLPDIFESLQATYRAVESRMTQEALRRHVLRVLRVWRERFLFSNEYLNGLQATFLQAQAPTDAANGGIPPTTNEALEAELAELADDDLERRCRFNGLSIRDGRAAQTARLLRLDHYINADSRPTPVAAAVAAGAGADGLSKGLALMQPHGQVEAAAEEDEEEEEELFPDALDGTSGTKQEPAVADGSQAALPAHPRAVSLPTSRWMTIDEDEEKLQMPQVPISKWLMEEQEQADRQLQQQQDAERQAAAAAAAASAAQIKSEADGDVSDSSSQGAEGGVATVKAEPVDSAGGAAAAAAAGAAGGAVAAGSVVDEERRRRLREVELSLVRHEAELEDQGLGREAVQAALAEKRIQLVADLDRVDLVKAAALEKWKAAKRERDAQRAAGTRDTSPPAARSRSRSRSRDADATRRGSEKDRSNKERVESSSKANDSGRDKDPRRTSSHRDDDRGPSTTTRRDSTSKSERSSSGKERDKERDKDKDRDKGKERDKERKDRSRSRERGGSGRRGSRSPDKSRRTSPDERRVSPDRRRASSPEKSKRTRSPDKEKNRRSSPDRGRDRNKRERGGGSSSAPAARSKSRSRSVSPSRHKSSRDGKKSRHK